MAETDGNRLERGYQRLSDEVLRASRQVLLSADLDLPDDLKESLAAEIAAAADLRLTTRSRLVDEIITQEGISRATAYRRVNELLPATLDISGDGLFLALDAEKAFRAQPEKDAILAQLWEQYITGDVSPGTTQ